MYVAVYKNEVISGPSQWNFAMFNIRFEEKGLTTSVPRTPQEPFIINEDAKVIPCDLTTPTFNDKIEYLEGPFITDVSGNTAIGHYILREKPVDAVKYVLKQEVAAERYKKENKLIKATVQGTEVDVDVSRDNRNVFIQKLIMMGENEISSWKFPQGFFMITKPELTQLVATGAAHIQAAFDWEKSKGDEIDACTTLAELDALDLEITSNVLPMMPGMP
jgi:hypothetical protein